MSNDAVFHDLCGGAGLIDEFCLMVVAHPDDEIVSAGALIQRIRNLLIVYVTDGAPKDIQYSLAAGCYSREEYATKRKKESENALALAGKGSGVSVRVGIVDQESSFQMPALVMKIGELIKKHSVSFIVTHPYEGGHPDHDTVSFAVWAACNLLKNDAPLRLEFTSYHSENGKMVTNRFLGQNESVENGVRMSEEQLLLKKRMVSCYGTQADMLKKFDLSKELLRPAPRYSYLKAPHQGPLFYEMFNWGISGSEWRSRAAQTMSLLGVKE